MPALHKRPQHVPRRLLIARAWLAYTQHDFAELLQTRDGRGDGARAETLLAAARATYRELGIVERPSAIGKARSGIRAK